MRAAYSQDIFSAIDEQLHDCLKADATMKADAALS